MRLKIIHFFIMLIVISVYFLISFQIVDVLKLDNFEIEKFELLIDLVFLFLFFIGLIFAGFFGNLLSFIFLAKVFNVTKLKVEEVFIKDVKLPLNKERIEKKGFNKWCIDKAYGSLPKRQE